MSIYGWLKSLFWDKVSSLYGKRVVILGARAVGKTHLIKFLSTGKIPVAYQQTLISEKIPARHVSLGDLNLKLKATVDVSGDKSAYGIWRELVVGCSATKRKKKVEVADIVIYLLRADRVFAGDVSTQVRVRADLRHIGEWLDQTSTLGSRPRFIIAGSHCDQDNVYNALTGATRGDYDDRFSQLPFVQEIIAYAGGRSVVKLALGSMATRSGTEQLATQIFKQAVDE